MFGINKKNTVSQKKESTYQPKSRLEVNNTKKNTNISATKQSAVPDLICKSYVDGCMVLGCVHDISQSELIVSLPGIGNFGFVKLNSISQVYSQLLRSSSGKDNDITGLSDMYAKGNLLRCKVVSYSNKKLYLTIDPKEINASLTFNTLEHNMIISGAVKSKEDHGYTVDLGVDDLTGFYKTSNFNLSLGQCVLFKLMTHKTERTITLNLCDSAQESTFYSVEKKYQFDSYLPGAKLHCTIERRAKNGYHVNISNQLFGYIHSNHLPIAKREAFMYTKKKDRDLQALEDTSATPNEFKNGDKICATIIFLNPYSKVVYLSLLPHLTDSTKPARVSKLFLENEEGLKLGQVIDNAQVALHTYKGVFIKFKGANKKLVMGFIPKRHLFEKLADQEEVEETNDGEEEDKVKKSKKQDAKNMNTEDLEAAFPLKSNIHARIFDLSLMEDMIILSHRKSVIKSRYMFYNELKVGQTVKAKIRGINANGGVNVYLSEFLCGFVPKIHTGDVPLSDMVIARKIKKGGLLKCMVIQLDPVDKRCVLTAKKSLINSQLPLIESFEGLKLGMETYGTVVSIQSYGILLSFMNDLKGLLPRQQISTSPIVRDENYNLKEIYFLGQLVRCRIWKFDSAKQQVKMSLIMKDDAAEKDEIAPEKDIEQNENKKVEEEDADEYEIGDLIENGIVVQVNEESEYLKVKLPTGTKNGILYKNQLSDLENLNNILFDCYKRGMPLNNLMIIRYSDSTNSKKQQCHYLTLKSSIVDTYTTVAKASISSSFTDLSQKDWHQGWIKKILDNGILIEIPHNLIGFTPKTEVAYLNELNLSTATALSTGHSCLVKINKLFNDKKQFTCSIRTRHNLMQTNSRDTAYMISIFKSYLTNTQLVFKNLQTLPLSTSSASNPTRQTDAELWQIASKLVKPGSVVTVVVKKFNLITRCIELAFIDALNNVNLKGTAFASYDEQTAKKYTPGTRLEALVLTFDPVSNSYCLTIEPKIIKTYKKNFDTKFRSQVALKLEQVIKAEIIFVSSWFCIVGLKAHGLGCLAFMPLFRNDFTQLDAFKGVCSGPEMAIKRQQLNRVSVAALGLLEERKIECSKEDKHFSYYCVGQVGKVCVKFNSDDYTLAVHDLSTTKQNKKSLLRQLSILNEMHIEGSEGSLKRKVDEEVVLMKKKVNLEVGNSRKRKLSEVDEKDAIEIVADVKRVEVDGEGVGGEFPWEVKNFDEFNKILNSLGNSGDGDEKSRDSQDKDKQAKKAKKIKKEFVDDKKLMEIEEKTYDPNRAPETIEDYERLLIASPNNSLLWIQYMAFHLQLGEIEKARDVAHKGLKTIIYREEAERLNVWVALLNMENIYGTQAKIDDAFNRANQNCDSFKVHLHMAEIYARSSKLQESEDIFMRMTKKFSARQDVWIKYAVFHYKNKNCELARKLLIRSLGSLEKKEHVEMVNKFAQLEFRFGDIERGKTMYDSLLYTYPNRTDIWSVYIDMLIKHEKHEDARAVFNRIVGLGLTVKRMKFIFKKFLEFEKIHGNEALIENVKEVAAKYVEANNSGSKSDERGGDSKSSEMEASLKKNLKI